MEQGSLWGCDREADRRRVISAPILCASAGSDPQRGPSSALDAPRLRDATVKVGVAEDHNALIDCGFVRECAPEYKVGRFVCAIVDRF